MKIPTLALAGAAFLAVSAVALSTPAPAGVKAGDSPTYTWNEAPIGALGKQTLASMQGKPILVEFWGTR